MKQSKIYLIEEKGTGHIKIGHSQDPAQRMRSLQTGNSKELALQYHTVFEEEAALLIEKRLHARFAGHHVKGEWFAVDLQTVRDAIAEEHELFKAESGADDLVDTGLPPVWCIYPRRDQQTVDFFLKKHCIGLGFGNMGNLLRIAPTLEAFRQTWESRHPFQSKGQIRALYPMFYSFVHRVKVGDLVIFPATWLEDAIHIGKIAGGYQFKRWQRAGYNDLRLVEWRGQVQRGAFSAEALRGIQVNLAFFRVRSETFLRELVGHVG